MRKSDFLKIFRGEVKNVLNKKKLVALALLLVFISFIINGAVSDLKELHKNSITFKKLETDKFTFLRTYTAYSMLGSRYIFTPSLLSFLGMSNSYENLSAGINIVSLNVLKNIKEGGILADDFNSPFNLTFIIMLFGTVVCMFYGTGIINKLEVYKNAVTNVGGHRIFYMVYIARSLLMLVAMFIIFLSILILLIIKGVYISSDSLGIIAGYSLGAYIMSHVTFLIGVIISLCRNKNLILTLVLLISFVMTYFIPGLLKSYIARKEAKIVSSYVLEAEQYSVFRDFENTSVEKYGKFSSNKLDLAKKIMNGFYENDYKKIEAIEDSFYNEVAELVKLNSLLSLFSPHTFFQLTADDVSSMGNTDFLKFYDMLKVEKKRFLRFFIDQTTKRPRKLVPFETNHVYYAEGSLPSLFWYGVFFNLFLIGVLFLWANWRYENRYYRLSDEKVDTGAVEIRMKSGSILLILCHYYDFFRRFLSVPHGKKRHFNGKIFIDDKPLDMSKKDVFHVINQAEMPGEVLLSDFLASYKRFLKMSNDSYTKLLASIDNSLLDKKIRDISASHRTGILLSLAENSGKRILLFWTFMEGVPKEDEETYAKRIKALKVEGKTICYFSIPAKHVVDSDIYYNILLLEGQYTATILS